ncbi:MAG: hypothetical protein KKB31_07895 [Nanoarchaeota archaeon]|nr:hypothetical protein [Nanoarchaeota archaeon]
MRDLIYLSMGDTTVPFTDYEGDTRAYCEGMRAAFDYFGVDTDITEMIVGQMEQKPQPVQKVFFLRILGLRQIDIAKLAGVHQSNVSRYLRHKCLDIRRILERAVGAEPVHISRHPIVS